VPAAQRDHVLLELGRDLERRNFGRVVAPCHVTTL